jgi:hypothetical protein
MIWYYLQLFIENLDSDTCDAKMDAINNIELIIKKGHNTIIVHTALKS